MKKLDSISYTKRKREYFKKGRSGHQCQMLLRCHGGEDWKNALLGFSQLKLNTNLSRELASVQWRDWLCEGVGVRDEETLTSSHVSWFRVLLNWPVCSPPRMAAAPSLRAVAHSTPLPAILWPFLLLHLPFSPRVAPFLGSSLLSEVELGALLLCFQGALCIFTITMTHTNWKCNHLSAVLSLLLGCELL